MELLTNQKKAFEKLRQYKVGALFKAPGTGKTRTAVELITCCTDTDYILWLAPYRSVNPKVDGTGIKSEFYKWFNLPTDTDFVGIESLSSSDRIYLNLIDKLKNKSKPFIVVDESLKIKNWTAIRTKRIVELARYAEYRLILNGTPISRSLLDLWAQMEFLSPKILNMGVSRFISTFCETVKITKRHNGKTQKREFIARYHNVDHLYMLIKNYVFEAELDLSVGMNEKEINYALDYDCLERYDALKEKYLNEDTLSILNNNFFLEMTTKMQHGYCCTEDKFVQLKNIIDQHGLDGILVFCRFIAAAEECKARFPGLTVLSIQSDSMSLNMQNKNITVFFDKVWDYALIKQAYHRTYRTGQLNDCWFYHFTGYVGLEKMMQQSIIKKKNLLEYFKSKSVAELKDLL